MRPHWGRRRNSASVGARASPMSRAICFIFSSGTAAADVAGAHAADGHQQHGAGRQRDQHADEAEQLAEGQQREDHDQRMQADALAHQPRRQVEAFDHLPAAVHGRHHDQRLDRRQTAAGRRPAPDQADAEADVRHEHGQPGEEADRQRQVESEQRQAGAVEDAHGQHHQQLAAQVLPQHLVGLIGEGVECRPRARRHQLEHTRHETLPVEQQVEQRHRNQHGVSDHRQRDAAAELERGQQRAQRVLVIGVQVPEQAYLQAGEVQRDRDALLHQPGRAA